MRAFYQFVTWSCLLVASICAAQVDAADEIRVLFLGDQGGHQPPARFKQLQPVLAKRGITVEYTEDVRVLNSETLGKFDALLVYANIDSIEPGAARALLKYVEDGGGFVPLHCASHCFRNSPEVVNLIGGQFKRHGTGIFATEISDAEHPILNGYGGFESWDETYVHHNHNEANRTVLEYRVDNEGREPWTWVRTHGKGRVFYTAWGHDARTWAQPGFHNLVERGIRWSVHQDPTAAGAFQGAGAFPVPKMKATNPAAPAFEYVEAAGKIPQYKPGRQDPPTTKIQKPLSPADSMKHLVVPEGFHVELFAAEPKLAGKPICMAWDERGRLWVAETYDYPNELQPPGKGRDRIRICEDTSGDGRADKFTVFAKGLSIPSSITFHRGGAIVQNGVETLYLKDTNGDDVADERRVMFTGWNLGDTHGGVSNFQYGLDNWIWAIQGYNNSQPRIGGKVTQQFRMGFFRFRPDGSEVEFIRSNNNNSWGLGISEEGLIFGSTANANPSVFMPIANRYYERVRGWAPSLMLGPIADTHRFQPITDKVRQVDQHGGYTAGTGHALYTARTYPREYWNRVAFVNGPTGHLTGAFVLTPDGSGFKSTSPFNLLASKDEWTAPIMSEVGPDGNVWVIDWYNYIIQHNPTPHGFATGKGRAYISKLRDKKHGRIYRVVHDKGKLPQPIDLSKATPDELVAALQHPTMLVRKHAQRLLVERGKQDVAAALIELIADQSTDAIGLNTAAIHALWTLHGLGTLDGKHQDANEAVIAALRHPSAGVRRNALQVLPQRTQSVDAVVASAVLDDPQPTVRVAALLALADLPPASVAGGALLKELGDPSNESDRWVQDAVICAAAVNSASFLQAAAQAKEPSQSVNRVATIVASHYARGEDWKDLGNLFNSLAGAEPSFADAVIEGLSQAWRKEAEVAITPELERDLAQLLPKLSPGSQSKLFKLVSLLGSDKFQGFSENLSKSLLATAKDEAIADNDRVQAAKRLIELRPDDEQTAKHVLAIISPRTSPVLALGICKALEASRAPAVGSLIVERLSTLTPTMREGALIVLLKRPALTKALIDGAANGTVSLADLTLAQQRSLSTHPDAAIQVQAKKLLAQGNVLPNADRQVVLESLLPITTTTGDAALGKRVFTKQCSKCHTVRGEGSKVGPDLTGMAVHSKQEILTHIIDPSRSVEGNFRLYTLITEDGQVLNGTLASESKTALELYDAEGKKHAVLREDIDELVASPKSIMPDGFEKQVSKKELGDLLEFLTQKGKFVPLDLAKAATIASDRPMFISEKNLHERLDFGDWSPKMVGEVPFTLVDPRAGTRPNVVLLHGPLGAISGKMPKSVTLDCHLPATAIHLLSGVSGWGHPLGKQKSVTMIVRLHYADRSTEDHELLNGVHFADYIRHVDVPGSQLAFMLGKQQIRNLTVKPRKALVIERIELLKGPDQTSPVVMAMTIESPEDLEAPVSE